MADLKTKLTDQNVMDFLNQIESDTKRQDAIALVELMKDVTGAEPRMWGTAIIGFGTYRLKYDSGRENDWFPVGFSPRKQNFALYLRGGAEMHKPLLAKLGKYKTGKGCIYVNKLSEVDLQVLRQMVKESADTSGES